MDKNKKLFLGFSLAFLSCCLTICCANAFADADKLHQEINARADKIAPEIVSIRRDIHQHPELSGSEERTSKIVADYLKSLGIETHTDIAHHGVVGILRGGLPGPVVALRADMDALPIVEETNLPFASQNKGVMHACGHDVHTSTLLGVANILASMRSELPGTVKFIFQPSEEGALAAGGYSGAKLMIKEGVLANPKPDVIFALHVNPSYYVGQIGYRPGAIMASADYFTIEVGGQKAHGAMPWQGVDAIVVAAQIVNNLQTIVSRQVNIIDSPSVITIGTIQGGARANIVADSVKMEGTIRTFDPVTRKEIQQRIQKMATEVANASGASANVIIKSGAPVTYNDPQLTAKMLPTLESVAGKGQLFVSLPWTTSEDFGYYEQVIPGMYFYLGVAPKNADLNKMAPIHSAKFMADEGAIKVGMKALASLAVDYMIKNNAN